MEEEEYLQLSGIQHFVFCRRQWALIHVENAWEENELTAEGRTMHERAHDSNIRSTRNGMIELRSLRIKSRELKIAGCCDVVELIPDSNGISFPHIEGKYRVRPVEYKLGKPKRDDSDVLQLAAECMCLEEMLACTITEGAIFYGSIKRRETVEITSVLRENVKKTLKEMHSYINKKYTPVVKTGKKCRSCSLSSICLPEILEREKVSIYISRHLSENEKTT